MTTATNVMMKGAPKMSAYFNVCVSVSPSQLVVDGAVVSQQATPWYYGE